MSSYHAFIQSISSYHITHELNQPLDQSLISLINQQKQKKKPLLNTKLIFFAYIYWVLAHTHHIRTTSVYITRRALCDISGRPIRQSNMIQYRTVFVLVYFFRISTAYSSTACTHMCSRARVAGGSPLQQSPRSCDWPLTSHFYTKNAKLSLSSGYTDAENTKKMQQEQLYTRKKKRSINRCSKNVYG